MPPQPSSRPPFPSCLEKDPAGLASLYLLYHELKPTREAYTYALSTEEFRSHLQLFQQILAQAGSLQPRLTFDDGHESNVRYALPLLEEFGLKAHFFITAGWVGKRAGYMDAGQLREMKHAGHRLGAHGWSHKLLTHCSARELEVELRDARRFLEDKLSHPVTTLSLPGGRSNARVLAACAAAGYTQVFTSAPRMEASAAAPLLGRLNLRAGTPLRWLEAVLRPESGVLRRVERQHRLKAAAQRALGDRLYAGLWKLLNRAQPELDQA